MNNNYLELFKKISFYEKFIAILNDHNDFDNSLDVPDLNILSNIINELGYKNRTNKKDKQIIILNNKKNTGLVSLMILFDFGKVNFHAQWHSHSINDKQYNMGSSFSFACNKLLGVSRGTRSPVFSDYEEAKEILVKLFDLYEEIVEAILEFEENCTI
ncbi:hypothetical protein [Marinicellulosiphila megalodicopiae]|uniref:hypothetical protein n=1 Tax=Marinicellulosiphila megalodicopiae TaxID=2724896 RepID=UPI003BB14489